MSKPHTASGSVGARTPRVALTRFTIRGTARAALLHRYDSDPTFGHDLQRLYRLRVRPLPWILPGSLVEWWSPLTRPGPRASRYVDALVALAQDHGLDRFRDDPPPGLGLEQIHAWCRDRREFGARRWPPKFFSSGFSIPVDEPAIFPIERSPGAPIMIDGRRYAVVFEDELGARAWDPRRESRLHAEQRLRAHGSNRATVRAALRDIEAEAVARGYGVLRARGHGTGSDLDRDFRWLYRRVHGETSGAIAASEGAPTMPSNVHKTTNRLANLIGISLPGWEPE